MYSIIQGIINYVSSSGYNDSSTVLAVCGAMICLISVVVIDRVFDIFSAICRG